MATVSEECKDFVTQIIEGMGRIQQSGRCNQEKVKRLMVLSNRVVEKMNEKPHRGKRTRKEKENDSAIRKRLENLYNKIQEALKKYPETDFPFYE
ncbi:MAG: hypothetical protein LBQ03_01265 [Puniceicoccales bacterium]|nr:hypothetical protein [Puniceicoccales bacterium]